MERLNIVAGATAKAIPAPAAIRRKLFGKLSYVRRNKLTQRSRGESSQPDYFVIEIFNPSKSAVALTLTVRTNESATPKAFQRLIQSSPGLTREKIPFHEIRNAVDTSRAFEVELVPNDAEAVTLFFGLMDFVQEESSAAGFPVPAPGSDKKCKCVVWDLDNTLWDGILIEDGVEKLVFRDGMKQVIEELDRRGVLQSIASKNNVDEAIAALKRFGIHDFFLYPQIHWSPKSESIAAIAKALNIGRDTIFFIDDQPFERVEVSSVLPEVRVADPALAAGMLDELAFQLPVTGESRNRRSMYRQEEERAIQLASHRGDYIGFLRENGMLASLSRLSEQNMQRVYELAQRTNQMNFSGKRYAISELQRLMASSGVDTYVIECQDRFGSYGIVGFSVVDRGEPRLLDLMFSCRVQAKRVEHKFLSWLLEKHRKDGQGDFFVNYRKTPKNAPSGAVFQELGFQEVGQSDGVTALCFARDHEISEEDVVEIIAQEGA